MASEDIKVIEVILDPVRGRLKLHRGGSSREHEVNDTGLRTFTKTAQWERGTGGGECPDTEAQWAALVGANNDDNTWQLMAQQIRTKMSGYRSQDIEKGIYDEVEFIDFDTIKEALVACNMRCYYCTEPVKILYSELRDKKQWTIDRVYNSIGHNKGNFVIACLGCNLHRRCRKATEYCETKNMVVIKEGVRGAEM
jgi:hypothetical protein